MSTVLSSSCARAILGTSFFAIGDVCVPFSRDELYRLKKGQFQLFFIPEGSLRHFPQALVPAHSVPVQGYREDAWMDMTITPRFVVAHPRTEVHLRGRALTEQKREVTRSILSPYEIAVMAAYWKRVGKSRLFEGEALTDLEVGVSTWTAPCRILVATLRYGSCDALTFGRCYETEEGPRAVMVGERRVSEN